MDVAGLLFAFGNLSHQEWTSHLEKEWLCSGTGRNVGPSWLAEPCLGFLLANDTGFQNNYIKFPELGPCLFIPRQGPLRGPSSPGWQRGTGLTLLWPATHSGA